MKVVTARSADLYDDRCRVDASYHASEGIKALRYLRDWVSDYPGQITVSSEARLLHERFTAYTTRRLDTLKSVCDANGLFVGDWLKRIYVNDAEHGAPYLTGSDILRADPLMGCKYLSYRHGNYIEQLRLRKRMILLTCSGTIGNMVYVNANLENAVGSPDLFRIIADPDHILPGYLYTFLSSPMGRALITQGIYGGVVQHIEIPYLEQLPIPRLDAAIEERIHALVERAASLRVEAKQRLGQAQQRFNRDVLRLSPSPQWKHLNEHARVVGVTCFTSETNRLDAFHYVGYVGEAEVVLPAWQPLGDLVEPYQPPLFKRPYTGETGMPFLSGMDLYDAYPKPHMYISRKMKGEVTPKNWTTC